MRLRNPSLLGFLVCRSTSRFRARPGRDRRNVLAQDGQTLGLQGRRLLVKLGYGVEGQHVQSNEIFRKPKGALRSQLLRSCVVNGCEVGDATQRLEGMPHHAMIGPGLLQGMQQLSGEGRHGGKASLFEGRLQVLSELRTVDDFVGRERFRIEGESVTELGRFAHGDELVTGNADADGLEWFGCFIDISSEYQAHLLALDELVRESFGASSTQGGIQRAPLFVLLDRFVQVLLEARAKHSRIHMALRIGLRIGLVHVDPVFGRTRQHRENRNQHESHGTPHTCFPSRSPATVQHEDSSVLDFAVTPVKLPENIMSRPWEVPPVRSVSRRDLLLAGLGMGLGIGASASPILASTQPPRWSHALLPGTRWETSCHVSASGRPGPIVVVMAGVHGDEPAGVQAADAIRTWTVARGTLLVIPRANQPAIAAKSRFTPQTPHADLARCFPQSATNMPRGTLASALWQLLARLQPDWFLDLHEGWGVHRRNPKTLGSTVLHASPHRSHAQMLVDAVNATIDDPGHHFVALEHFIPGSSVYAASRWLRVACLVQETTRVGRPLRLRVQQHEVMTRTLLTGLKMIASA